jgi:hypothetical protein
MAMTPEGKVKDIVKERVIAIVMIIYRLLMKLYIFHVESFDNYNVLQLLVT